MDLIKASDKLSQLELTITADNLEIDVLWFRAMIQKGDWFINRHRHSSFEFHFVRSGSCRVILDDGEFNVGEKEFYLTAPGVFHRQESLNKNGIVEYCINCDLKLLDSKESEMALLMRLLLNSPCRCIRDEYGSIELFYNALTEAVAQPFGFYNSIKSLVVMILISAARAMDDGTSEKLSIPVKLNKNDYRLRQIEEFIDDNIYDKICAEDIAKVMFLSSRQVNRIVRQANGMTTKEFIMRKKHDKAKHLLKDSACSIQEISERLGFSSEYYFSQFFKKHEGFSPSEFRLNVNNVR